MENKKTIIGIIILVVLIIALGVSSYLFYNYNNEQVNILTEETNKILQLDLSTDEIDTEIKTQDDFATVEKAIKEYIVKLKNIYLEIETLEEGINADTIFASANIEDKDLEEIDAIIEDYKTKAEESISEYENLIKEENISNNIKEKNFSFRESYFIELYNSAMLSDVMNQQYEALKSKIEDKKDEITDKMAIIEDIKEYLDEHTRYWKVNDEGKIEFTNINVMTEYYNLINELSD